MKERIKHLLLFIILIIIDQASKFWVKTVLMNQEPISIIRGVLKLQYLENKGAVWGIMSGKVDFLRILTFIILLVIVFFFFKIPNEKKYNVLKIISVFILAGAVGNLIDRIYLGYVVDFIYFELINFPIFNIADSYLTVSSVLLLLLALFYYKDEDFVFLEKLFKKKKPTADSSETPEKDANWEVPDSKVQDDAANMEQKDDRNEI